MSEENKAIARRGIEEFLNTGNPEVADEIFAADYVDHNPSNPEMSGVENIKRSVSDWHTAFPDTYNAVEDVISEGDKVAVCWVTRATHQVDRIPGSDKLRDVGKPALFEAPRQRSLPQARLFGMEEVLGAEWLKALKLGEYAPRRPHRPQALQEVLFPYAEALWKQG